MKTLKSSSTLLFLLVISLTGCTKNPTEEIQKKPTTSQSEISYEINSDDSSIKDFGKYEGDLVFSSEIQDLVIVDQEWNDQIDGEYMFFTDITDNNLYVNQNIFNDLSILSANQLDEYEKHIVGRYKGDSKEYQKIIDLLIYSQVINTYDHVSATFDLVEVKEDNDQYYSYFTGSHTYCTNKCITEDFDFIITIDKTSGIIKLSRPVKNDR